MHLLFFYWCIDDDTNGKEVVNTLELAMLLLHLLPDGVDTLRTAFDVEMQASLCQSLRDRLDELFNISIATFLCLAQLLLDMIVGIVLQIFQ